MSADPVVRLSDATVRRGGAVVWRDLSLTVQPGEFVVLLGPNGSGKTTLLQTLLGLLPLSAGELTWGPIGRPSIGYVAQRQPVDPLTPVQARQVVGLGLDGHRWGPGWPSRRRATAVAEALAATGASQLADKPIGQLSGGEQQRIRLAQAVIARPQLLLCDEPLASLDPESQHAIAALVDRERREHGTAVLISTHEVDPVRPFADRYVDLAQAPAAAR